VKETLLHGDFLKDVFQDALELPLGDWRRNQWDLYAAYAFQPSVGAAVYDSGEWWALPTLLFLKVLMSTAESIYELVKTLPEEEASLVLEFVEFMSQRPQSKAKTLTASNVGGFQAVSITTKGFTFNRDKANER
jgi:hypothetical protein